jgi:uncharacterized membrane protein HdeD (DUF308 family)
MDRPLTRHQAVIFSVTTVFGALALLFGVYLIIFMRYHERAYVFLGMGAACFIGGIAGLAAAGSKIKAALSYGVIALGIVGIVVGINYLTYRFASYQTRGHIVIALSILIVLGGIIAALIVQPRRGFAAFSSVIMLGVIASAGIMALIVGTIYLSAFEYQGHAYPLLAAGAVCLVCGILCGIYAQSKVAAPRRVS